MAACSAGVLVSAPANIPSVCAGDTPNAAPADQSHGRARRSTPDGAERVPLQPGSTQTCEELPAVLNADAVEEHHEADRTHQRRRRRLGRDRPERQARKSTAPMSSEKPAIEIRPMA